MSPLRAASLLAALLFSLPIGASAQELKLKPIIPLGGLKLAPALGIVEDSLRMVGRGVYLRDVQVGNGEPVDSTSEISLHFVGMLTNGKIFTATSAQPFRFRMGTGQVIDGWEDGLRGMRVGGRRQLVIPPFLGYGGEAYGEIPADATLVFDITLVELHR